MSALSASSLGSDLETSAEKKAKSVVKCVPARGRGKKYVSVAKFGSTEEFESSDVFKVLKEDFNNDRSSSNKNSATIIHCCKFSKKKKGFNCLAKMKTLQQGSEVEAFDIEDMITLNMVSVQIKYVIKYIRLICFPSEIEITQVKKGQYFI